MKRIFSITFIFVLSLILCSCDPSSFIIEDNAFDNVIKIELVIYKNTNQKEFISWVPDYFDDLKNYDISKEETIEVLHEERINEFAISFKETDILNKYYAYDSPKDICIKATYKNGDFLIIWADYIRGSFAGYIGEFYNSGKPKSFWGSFSDMQYYVDLVNNYFSYTLPITD